MKRGKKRRKVVTNISRGMEKRGSTGRNDRRKWNPLYKGEHRSLKTGKGTGGSLGRRKFQKRGGERLETKTTSE